MSYRDLADRMGMEANVGRGERVASTAVGAGLLAFGASRRSALGTVAALGGAALVLRGATGFCPVYAATGHSTAPGAQPGDEGEAAESGAPRPFSRRPAPLVDAAADDEGVAFGEDPGAAPPMGAADHDEVDEASEESFPASDPPSFTPDSHMGGPAR